MDDSGHTQSDNLICGWLGWTVDGASSNMLIRHVPVYDSVKFLGDFWVLGFWLSLSPIHPLTHPSFQMQAAWPVSHCTLIVMHAHACMETQGR